MGSSNFEENVQVFDALDRAVDRLCELSFDVLTTEEKLQALERLELMARQLRILSTRCSTNLKRRPASSWLDAPQSTPRDSNCLRRGL
jgi:hypothetical protein